VKCKYFTLSSISNADKRHNIARKFSDNCIKDKFSGTLPVYQYRLQMDYAGGIFIYTTPHDPSKNLLQRRKNEKKTQP